MYYQQIHSRWFTGEIEFYGVEFSAKICTMLYNVPCITSSCTMYCTEHSRWLTGEFVFNAIDCRMYY